MKNLIKSILHIFLISSLTIFVFWSTTGTLFGSKEIGLVEMGAASKGSTGGYFFDEEALKSSLKNVLNEKESDYRALLPVPLNIYSRKICGKIIGHNYASIRIIFGNENGKNLEMVVGDPNVEPCILYSKNNVSLFSLENPEPSLARVKEDEVNGYFDYIHETMMPTPGIFGNFKRWYLDWKYSNQLKITYKLSTNPILIYFFSLIFVLGTSSLFIDNSVKIQKYVIGPIIEYIKTIFKI